MREVNRPELVGIWEGERNYIRCLMLADMIKGTTDSKKKKRLKTTLEVEVLFFWMTSPIRLRSGK
jgi:hypothetical protein